MSYLGYVVAAYAVFALAMAWDWLAPRLQLRAALRAIRLRASRKPGSGAAPGAELRR